MLEVNSLQRSRYFSKQQRTSEATWNMSKIREHLMKYKLNSISNMPFNIIKHCHVFSIASARALSQIRNLSEHSLLSQAYIFFLSLSSLCLNIIALNSFSYKSKTYTRYKFYRSIENCFLICPPRF
jgi:hypothetical protein